MLPKYEINPMETGRTWNFIVREIHEAKFSVVADTFAEAKEILQKEWDKHSNEYFLEISDTEIEGD